MNKSASLGTVNNHVVRVPWRLWAMACVLAFTPAVQNASGESSPYLETVKTFADNALAHGKDVYRDTPTPLFVDGLNVDTLEPVRWIHEGQSWICSNLASQQNFFRVLTALSNMTGDALYKDAARAAIAWHFEHLQRSCGLLQWGGHRFIDLATYEVVGEQDTHELKWSFPYYELMWEVNPHATRQFIRAFWNAHILDWETLDMNRHGRYGREMGSLWDNVYVGGEPFFPARGLTFLNTGSDLMHAAFSLAALDGDQDAETWALRMMRRYVDARNPITQLGAYQYSGLVNNNDRALRQFAPEFPGQVVREGTMLSSSGIYGTGGISQLYMAEKLGADGREMLGWIRDGLAAYARYAYEPETNMLAPVLTDGTRLLPEHVNRVGYYSESIARESRADGALFFSYARAYRLTGDPALWETARHMARANGLGDLGERPGVATAVASDPHSSDPMLLFGVLELCRAHDDEAYRMLARRLGDVICEQRFHKGFFVPSERHVNAPLDALEPLALLSLEALLRNTPEAVPIYPGGRGYIHGPHDGVGRTTDGAVIWSQTRK